MIPYNQTSEIVKAYLQALDPTNYWVLVSIMLSRHGQAHVHLHHPFPPCIPTRVDKTTQPSWCLCKSSFSGGVAHDELHLLAAGWSWIESYLVIQHLARSMLPLAAHCLTMTL